MHDYSKAFRLDGKVALITGAARGLGAEIARAFVQAGAKVMVTDIGDKGAAGTASEIRKTGGTAEHMVQDVTSESGWEATVAATVSKLGGLDVLVNNAGIEIGALVAQCTLEDFRKTQDINVTGTFLGIRAAIRAMSPGGAAGKGGSIINMSSVAGIVGVTAHGAYGASKGAVRTLTKAAAVECGRLGTGIRVNSMHPGLVSTAMGTQLLDGLVSLGLAPDRAAADAAILALHPLGKFGEPYDVACGALYLASDASRWVTASELVIDGGVAGS
jgi:NAD(P)-dependent dehydrogenase (short-subunit alcohol dehydrogenase family)